MRYRSGPSWLEFHDTGRIPPDTEFERDFSQDGEHGEAHEALMLASGSAVRVEDETPAPPAAVSEAPAAAAAVQETVEPGDHSPHEENE